ncbi:MAG: DUF87 domain-containing protein [Desulfurococcales archaeon]|nr:DUF87 domain-containing protein [Desulfurococcales archaeon]
MLFKKSRGRNPPVAGRTLWWQVDVAPYEDMPESERDRLISGFTRWIASLRRKAWVHAVAEEGTIEWEDLRAEYRALRYYIEAHRDDDPVIAGLQARMALPLERPWPVKEKYKSVLLTGGVWARTYLLARLPPSLPEAFLAGAPWDELHILLEPFSKVDRLRTKWRRLSIAAREGYLAEIAEALEALLAEASAGHRVLRVKVLAVVKAPGLEELEEKARALESYLDGLGVKYQAPLRGQARLYVLDPTAMWLANGVLASSAAAHALYTFVSEELSHPDGLFMGFNVRTGSPIVYNPYQMPNYNVVVLGETGSGKSMTGKIYIRRWWRRFLSPVYIIDPSGEYAKVAQRLSPELQVYRADPEAAGLDPVRLHGQGLLDFSTVYEILSDVYGLQRREEKLQLLEALDDAGSMEDLIESGVLREARADMGLFDGMPPELGSNGSGVVFDLSELRGKRQKVLAGAVLAGLLRPRLRSRSLLVVDEGWMWAEYPALMHMLAETSRVGRKYGVNFLFLTQRPADVLRSEAGRTILEQSSTVLLLRLNEASIAAIRDIYMLTEGEEQRLIEARPGEGVLRAGHWRLAVYIQPSKTELREFTTRPGEW